jgi:hypothetical protein
MKQGALLMIYRDDNTIYFRLFKIFHIALIYKNDREGLGGRLTLGIFNLETTIALTKRRVQYVIERIKDQTGPQASA